MYHEIELPGRATCQKAPGYVRYVVRKADLESQLNWLHANGWHGLSVGQALRSAGAKEVVITFDDGCETDLITAAPLLRSLGYSATFYVTVDFLGRPGFLTHAQLRQLSDQGFEVGCHSMTHPHLTDLSTKELHYEIADAKTALEQIIGRSVDHFSCPGGRWNRRVLEIARGAAYQSLVNSRPQVNSPSTNPFSLGRVAVLRTTDKVAFQKLCRGQGLLPLRLQDSARGVAKSLLGNSLYDRMRARFLS